MSSSARGVLCPHLVEVGREERLGLRPVQLVVDREVRQVEEAVANSGVLPVDDAQDVAVVEEVRVQEIVVARDGVGCRALAFDPAGELVCPLVVVRDRPPRSSAVCR